MNHIDQARKLLLMAAKDMKAWITAIGGTYGFIHDLWVLLMTLRELGCDIDQFKNLIMLNPFAAQLRYEPLETADAPLDRPALRRQVQDLYDHVQSAIAAISTI